MKLQKEITWSPWGYPQHQKEYAVGVVWVSTAGHGGFFVSDENLEKMPADCRDVKTYAGKNWYEEDCDWAIVCLAFPELFEKQDPASFYFAMATVECSVCDNLNHLATPERKAKRDAWLKEHGDKWATGGGMTSDKIIDGVKHFGWVQSIYKLTDRAQTKSKWFPGVVHLPSIFTLEEFENAKLVRDVLDVQFLGNAA